MYFQFLVEDKSAQILIGHVMNRLQTENPAVGYDCKSFKGIGGLKKDTKKTAKISDIKTNKLLNDLPMYLRAFDKSLHGIEAAIFVVLDNDRRDTEAFRNRLEDLAVRSMISIDHVFCIAVEEIEAWLLGDREALFGAYPLARATVLRDYKQDSICGTWEVLANAVYKGGMQQFRKDCPTYHDVGRNKAEWADRIGSHMNPNQNLSPSFQKFYNELRIRLTVA